MSAPRIANGRPGAALIGEGFFGPVHVEAPRRIGIEVVGLLDISPERVKPQTDRLAIKRVFLQSPIG